MSARRPTHLRPGRPSQDEARASLSGEGIRLRRVVADLSLDEVRSAIEARGLKLSRSTLHSWEQAESASVPRSAAAALAHVYRCSIAALATLPSLEENS